MAKRYWINYLKEYVFTPTAPASDTTSQTGTFKALLERLLSQASAYSGKPWYQSPDTTLSNSATHIADASGGAHGGVYNKIQKDGVDVAKQRIANFTGPGVTVSDDGTNARTNIDIPGGAGGGGGGSAHIIQEEGATLTARSRLNFVGVAATASDDAGNDRTNVTIRGNVTRSSTAPTSPVTGENWADTNTSPATARNYTGSAWEAVQATPLDASVTDIKVAPGAGIAKSKLSALAVDTADLAANRLLLITCTSGSRPATPLNGQAIYEADTEKVMVNTGSPVTPVWTSITATQTYQSPAYIDGLYLTYDAANTLGIETGAAYIPSSSSVLSVPTRLTRAVSFNASESTFRYAYLFDNGGTPDIEISQTAPDAAYFGTARTKTGDNTRRYLGAIRPNGAATPAMYKFRRYTDNLVMYLESIRNSPFNVLPDGRSTTEATVSCSGIVPPTTRLAKTQIWAEADPYFYIGNSEDNLTLSNSNFLAMVASDFVDNAGVSHQRDLQLDSAQAFTYMAGGAFAGTFGLRVLVQGYHEAR